MEDRERALRILESSPLEYCAPLNMIKRGAVILRASGAGALLRDEEAETFMLASHGDGSEPLSWLEGLDGCELLMLTDAALGGEAGKLLGLEIKLECLQFVYDKKEPPAERGGFEISQADENELAVIKKLYTQTSEREVEAVWRAGELFAARLPDGSLAGFAGCHPEGSMGMLHVLERYRGHGCGRRLESFLIALQLSRGLTPYAHIFPDNAASIALQRSLGLTQTPGSAAWLW